ncbi:hypothetical protein H5410_001562 [Solanum commersonii]|uniref:RNase H type-1 domain-containing protein n=1 Tax=Solanum commersonii TaxID=4109 RepID=A0A9J6AZ37_SOLCO|nr:hypothetical protein H5410_001562 [Solanum commersonii]
MDRFKCNTDGTSKGNPGSGSIAFCVLDEGGNLIFAEARYVEICTAVVAKEVVHTFREGNNLADFLANHVAHFAGKDSMDVFHFGCILNQIAG